MRFAVSLCVVLVTIPAAADAPPAYDFSGWCSVSAKTRYAVFTCMQIEERDYVHLMKAYSTAPAIAREECDRKVRAESRGLGSYHALRQCLE
jgi:hypothetical protein